jgi:predicted N-acetyltransferase YhbS
LLYAEGMEIREIDLADYTKVARFWRKYYRFSNRDTEEKIEIFLRKNPGLSVLVEEKDEIVGTALASFDGRKGYIQKVVVREDFQGRNLGLGLVKEVIKRLKKAGSLDIRVNCDKHLVFFTRNSVLK